MCIFVFNLFFYSKCISSQLNSELDRIFFFFLIRILRRIDVFERITIWFMIRCSRVTTPIWNHIIIVFKNNYWNQNKGYIGVDSYIKMSQIVVNFNWVIFFILKRNVKHETQKQTKKSNTQKKNENPTEARINKKRKRIQQTPSKSLLLLSIIFVLSFIRIGIDNTSAIHAIGLAEL